MLRTSLSCFIQILTGTMKNKKQERDTLLLLTRLHKIVLFFKQSLARFQSSQRYTYMYMQIVRVALLSCSRATNLPSDTFRHKNPAIILYCILMSCMALHRPHNVLPYTDIIAYLTAKAGLRGSMIGLLGLLCEW